VWTLTSATTAVLPMRIFQKGAKALSICMAPYLPRLHYVELRECLRAEAIEGLPIKQQ
jgi:hypothetical protein